MTVKCLGFCATLAILAASPLAAKNITLLEGGRVSIDFVNTEAQYRNTVLLMRVTVPGTSSVTVGTSGCKAEKPTGKEEIALVTNKLSAFGCRVTLDRDARTINQFEVFPAGTTFELGLCVDKLSNGLCDHLWSSDPNQNPDGADHLLQEPIRPDRFPGILLRLGWEDSPNNGDQDFNDTILYLRVERDRDGDGLWDDWEEFGIDTNGDGEIDFRLPGANPNRKDVYLEIDWMGKSDDGSHDHKPSLEAIQIVVDAFANAPVSNPDGSTGITLHVDVSNEIDHIDVIDFGLDSGKVKFEELKDRHFNQKNGRRLVYRYAIFGHAYDGTGSSGVAETPGDDLMVTLKDVGKGGVAGTLMHELGHTLGLRHGGGDDINSKPNYRSVMNYDHQFSGVPFLEEPFTQTVGGEVRQVQSSRTIYRYDYSRIKLPTLDEAALNESDPFYPAESVVTRRTFRGENDTVQELVERPGVSYHCKIGQAGELGLTVGWVTDGLGLDWNCNGNRRERLVQVDLNKGRGTKLNGYNDWENLVYTFQNDPLRFGAVYREPDQFEQSPQEAAEAETKIIRGPIASIQPTASPVSSRQIELDGSLSSVPGGGPIASYAWRVAGLPAALTNERGPRVVVQFGSGPGEYRFELTVTAQSGLTNTATTTVVYAGR